jgi:hypothetical protein
MSIALTSEVGADVHVSRCSIISNYTLGEGGGISIRGDLYDARLEDNTICDNLPDDVSGDYLDAGGNSFCKCVADIDGDGDVDGSDLAYILSYWGVCDDPGDCANDFNGDGRINGADLTIILSSWGMCQ